MKEYLELTKREIDLLDRDRTVFVSALSPIEVHGTHLPVGTDLYIAIEVMNRFADTLKDYEVVHLPDLPLGAQPLPVSGSLPVKWRALRSLLLGWGKKLSTMGFKYWVLIDNHGGYSHQLAIAEAYKKLLKGERFYLVAPFIFIIRDMTENCKEIGLPEGRVGGLDDPHAGTNETSLMLAVNKRLVSKNYLTLGKYFPDRKTLFGRIVRTLLREESMAISLDWINDPASPFYIGNPSIADRESGEVMIEFHVKRCVEVFNDAVRGEYRLPRLFSRMTSLILRAYPEW